MNAQRGQALESISKESFSASENAAAKPTPSLSTLSSSQIWGSKISWRITLSVFVTMVLVQVTLMAFTLDAYEKNKLEELRVQVRTALSPLLYAEATPVLGQRNASALLSRTPITGIALYDLNLTLVESYGAATLVQPSSNDIYLTKDLRRYETTFGPDELGGPYHAVVRTDASPVDQLMTDHIRESLIVFILLSGFVTCVLMFALGQWLLDPIMLLRNNLLNAARNPENPTIKKVPVNMQDEIGVALRIANDLIRQNAHNLKRLRAQAEDKIHHLAYFDTLTGLPNRTHFLEKLEESVRRNVIEEDKRLAVFSVDLDHFKDINDTMGHDIGDKILEVVGKRLLKAAPEGSLVARASADEFSIMTVLDGDVKVDSSRIAQDLLAAVAEPVSILQEKFQVRASIGVAHCPDDGLDGSLIVKNADIALNRAKVEGRDTIRYYSEDFDRAVQQRFQMLRDLRSAIDNNELMLHYHPQFSLKTGEIIGVEALLRWWRPDNSRQGGSLVAPAEFIPLAEQSGLIVPIGEWVMREACRANKRWQEQGLPKVRIAVNISGVQFHRGDIVRIVGDVLKETGLDPQWLELEVTESVFMENMDVAIDILHQLHSLGVELAVDDFGTGYSSLSYLRRFPIDRLKIDQSFTRNALTDPGDATITRTIINLGHSLGLKVIAEGVETADHENFLRAEGCDEVQGYRYSKPVPEDALINFIHAWDESEITQRSS